jgi:hypothetical protein
MTIDPQQRKSLQSMLENLARELFQTETSASLHCRREAKRLAGTPPGQVMLEVSEQAAGVLERLPRLAAEHGLPISRGGMFVGAMFSSLRERVADHLMEAERSYRGTLLGMRHGVDVVLLTRHAARQASLPALEAFCDEWLDNRLPLVTKVEEQLAWFATNSHRATELARPLPFVGRARHA